MRSNQHSTHQLSVDYYGHLFREHNRSTRSSLDMGRERSWRCTLRSMWHVCGETRRKADLLLSFCVKVGYAICLLNDIPGQHSLKVMPVCLAYPPPAKIHAQKWWGEDSEVNNHDDHFFFFARVTVRRTGEKQVRRQERARHHPACRGHRWTCFWGHTTVWPGLERVCSTRYSTTEIQNRGNEQPRLHSTQEPEDCNSHPVLPSRL